jgi:hypothetical protein
MLKKYGLTEGDKPIPFEKFDYLAKSECFKVDGIDDAALFDEV